MCSKMIQLSLSLVTSLIIGQMREYYILNSNSVLKAPFMETFCELSAIFCSKILQPSCPCQESPKKIFTKLPPNFFPQIKTHITTGVSSKRVIEQGNQNNSEFHQTIIQQNITGKEFAGTTATSHPSLQLRCL